MGICSAGFLLLVAGRVFTAHFLVEQSGLGLRNAGVVVTVLGLVGGAPRWISGIVTVLGLVPSLDLLAAVRY